MVTDNKVVHEIGEEVQAEYEFIPILTIISIITSAIQLLQRCSGAKDPGTIMDIQKIEDSYFITIDDDNNIVDSEPPLTRHL